MPNAEITPTPTDEEAVAIVAAMDALWPRPTSAATTVPATSPAWRFSGRWWHRDRFAAAERPWS